MTTVIHLSALQQRIFEQSTYHIEHQPIAAYDSTTYLRGGTEKAFLLCGKDYIVMLKSPFEETKKAIWQCGNADGGL